MFIHVFVSLLIIQCIFSICTSTNLYFIDNLIVTFRCNHVTIWCPLYKPISRLVWMMIIWRTYFWNDACIFTPGLRHLQINVFVLWEDRIVPIFAKKKCVRYFIFSMTFYELQSLLLNTSCHIQVLRFYAELFLFYMYNIYFSTLTFLMRLLIWHSQQNWHSILLETFYHLI